MKQIQFSADIFQNIIPAQEFSVGEKYRFLHYVVKQQVAEGTLIYNVLTRNMILMELSENIDDADIKKYLVQNYFLVPEDFDDLNFEKQSKAIYKLIKKNNEFVNLFTIFTTTDCNARCYYCFEKGVVKKKMSNDTALKVAQYIKDKSNGYKARIRWFGGEPLFNLSVIDLISQKLIDFHIEYESTMTSNGYLFDENIIQRAKDLWNLSFVQITLDGTHERYRRAKAFIYKDPNPLERVLHNIELLLEAGIRVDIRMNFSKQNASDLLELVELIGKRFGYNELLHLYSRPIYETIGPTKGEKSNEQRREIYEARMKIENGINELGYGLRKKLSKDLMLNSCMADSDHAVVILPDGKLTKCEHYSDTESFGDIFNNTVDNDVLNRFKEVIPDFDSCKTCPLHPVCINLKMCTEHTYCFPERRRESIDRTKTCMLNTYKQFVNKKKLEKEDDGTELQC